MGYRAHTGGQRGYCRINWRSVGCLRRSEIAGTPRGGDGFPAAALQGWCPPVPFFRSRGVRTAYEINQERYALKALRGDFAKTLDGAAASGWAAPAATAEGKAQQAVEATRG